MTPKLTVKPTPAQARYLDALYKNRGLFILLGSTAAWRGTGSFFVTKDLGRPRIAIVRALLREGWVEDVGDSQWNKLLTITDAGIEALVWYNEDPPSPKMTMNARMILDVLRKRHEPPEWIFVEELRLGTGWGFRATSKGRAYSVEKRVDAFALHCWPSKGFLKIVYEVKVSRSDFLREIAEPSKRAAAMSLSNQYFFATPEGLIVPSEVPEGCGLVEVFGTRSRVAKQADHRRADEPDWSFVAALGRAMQK